MTKTLLIVSGGSEAAEVARRVREMGHTVVVSDADPQAPAFAFADSCLIADVYGASETAAAAERYSRKIRKIDGVLCVADAALTAGAKPLQSFELAGADRKFHPASALIEGGTVVVTSPQVREPVAVRYAWSDNPEANLYNGAGLPAVPFRRDAW